MKKILSVFLALMISAFLLASCGASPSSNSVSGTRFNGDYEIASHEKFNSPADQNGLGGSKIVAAGILQELIQVDTSTVGILKMENGSFFFQMKSMKLMLSVRFLIGSLKAKKSLYLVSMKAIPMPTKCLL